ncbi:MAG: fumarate hydratase C-terminal domain-containing protein [Spirochaetes bacterium]|nr:fumarate hydratase C-terminal domain-containing protein [Spirochaetota bacterium]MBL7006073.1 fumarate hydratase C-terminal domain-containing protein [Spirochaetia bacterium]
MERSVRSLSLPMSRKIAADLCAGDEILLSGTMLVGRDQVHEQFHKIIKAGKVLPVPLEGETIFYMGPAPAPEGAVIGSCGPTTSSRMDPFTPELLDAGLVGMIGKGPRSSAVQEAVIRNGAVYFYAFGGCGALYAQKVTSIVCLAFQEFGPEALYRITIKDFPVIAAMDSRGVSIL